jgi:hypothetical protein
MQRFEGMTLQLGALRDALLEAGATPEKADRAAEESAAFDTRFIATDRAIAELSAHVDQGFVKINGEISELQWMIATTLAGVGAILVKLFISH